MTDRASIHRARRQAAAARLAVTGLLALLAGCATDRDSARTPTNDLQDTARFYWQYAPLAADIYRTGGNVDTQIAMALASPWLRAEVLASNDEAAKASFDEQLGSGAARRYQERLRERLRGRCADGPEHTAASLDGAVWLSEGRCKTRLDALQEAEADPPVPAAETNRFEAATPAGAADCDFRDRKEPAVPLQAAIDEFGWERVPELQRQTHARAWAIFVPDLAIDVWRRKRAATEAGPVVEYAVVYRGTVGGGGWVSNLRAVTAFTPFVWDQYRQARQATIAIVNQVYQLHALSDSLFKRQAPTRILITTVGHSLGAGLANYIYLVVPQITRVVGFDPSPVDGSSMVRLDDRPRVMTERRQPPDHDPRDPGAAVYLLFEEGEIISRLAQCASGPVWGDEGGPRVRCESVDFSRGNIFRQHNMPQLACKLYLARHGLPVR